ncbi:MAG UNVERIFIED_CONTAM: sugar phosphate isomerase/epimerase [Rickettsiaceae bacterium]|jgi:sugar phosphate isomerase/epimerase
MNRRDFIASAIALTASATLGREDKKDPFGGFRLGAQSYTFREFNLEQALMRMQKLGLKYGEFYQKHCPMTTDEASIKAFQKICSDYGVTPWAWGVQAFTKNHDANKKVFEFGKALGLKMFSADPTPDSFDSLDKLCDEYKIAIGIHPHGPAGKGLHRWYSAEVILAAVKDHHKLIGACLDTGHLIRSAQMGKTLDPAAQVKLMGERNFGLHLKDHDNKAKHDVIIGKGALDVPKLLAALAEVKFTGMISIEYEHNSKEPTKDVESCVKVFSDAASKR